MTSLDDYSETLKKLKAVRDEALKLADTKLEEVLGIFTALEMQHREVIADYDREYGGHTVLSVIEKIRKFCIVKKDNNGLVDVSLYSKGARG